MVYSRIIIAVDEHRVKIRIQILVQHDGQDFRENSKIFTLNVQKTAEFLLDSSNDCTVITMRHFLLIKLREINVFNTNFHRENLHDFPSFLVLFQSCAGRTPG